MPTTHEELRPENGRMEKRYARRFQAVFKTLRQMLETPIAAKKTDRISHQASVPQKASKACEDKCK